MGVPPPPSTEPPPARRFGAGPPASRGRCLRRAVRQRAAGVRRDRRDAAGAADATCAGRSARATSRSGSWSARSPLTSVVCRPLAGRQSDRARPADRARRGRARDGARRRALPALRQRARRSSLARLVVGAGEGSVYTAGATWAVDLAPEDQRGLALGLFGLAVWGGLSLGPVAGELLRSNVGYDAVWVLTAALPRAGALIAMRLPEPVDRTRSSPPSRAALFPPRGAAARASRWRSRTSATPRSPGFVVLRLKSRGIDGGAARVHGLRGRGVREPARAQPRARPRRARGRRRRRRRCSRRSG